MSINIVRRLGAFLGQWRVWGLAGIISILSFGALAGGVIDLGYKISRGGTPLTQVYDDGSRTYLIFTNDTDVRALRRMTRSIMATRDGKVSFAILDMSSPYPSIVGVYDQIALMIDGRQATATYVGSRRQPVMEPAGVAEAGRNIYIRKTPAQEIPASGEEQAAIPGGGQAIEAAPEGVAPPAGMGGQRIGTYAGKRRQVVVEPAGAAEAGGRISIRKTPVPEAQADEAQEGAIPDGGGQAAAPTPAGASSLEREVLPSNQVAKVVAKTTEDPLPSAPVSAAAGEREDAGWAVANREGGDYKVEYKVMVPFGTGKTVLGKDGEKAMLEVTQIAPIAKEIRIRAPGDSGNNLQSAHSRAAEIHKLLVKAGVVHQRISIEAIDAVPDGKIVNAEVGLIIDLRPKLKK